MATLTLAQLTTEEDKSGGAWPNRYGWMEEGIAAICDTGFLVYRPPIALLKII